MLLYLLTFILGAFIMPNCFKPNSDPLCHLSHTRFRFRCLYFIYGQFQVPLLCQITLSLILDRFVTHPVPDFALDVYIVSMNKICTCYPAEIKCHGKRGKILIAKSIDNIPTLYQIWLFDIESLGKLNFSSYFRRLCYTRLLQARPQAILSSTLHQIPL